MTQPQPTPTAEEMNTLIDEMHSLEQETCRSSFGCPASQGEIEAYENNADRIIEILHIVMPHFVSLQAQLAALKAENERLREALSEANSLWMQEHGKPMLCIEQALSPKSDSIKENAE